jgi:hypothetical protein
MATDARATGAGEAEIVVGPTGFARLGEYF